MGEPVRPLRFHAGERAGEVGALLLRPPEARWLLVLAHGAGAGMEHPFLEAVARRLAGLRVATFRYRFPYTERGRRRPDPAPVLQATVAAAVLAAREAAPGLPLLAGGKSMGGRMTSLAASAGTLPEVAGLVFLGFPLHAAGRPSAERGEHLVRVASPMLFLQGTRDRLADLTLLRPVLERAGGRARLAVFEGADHSFAVPKRSGLSGEQVLDGLAGEIAGWAREICR